MIYLRTATVEDVDTLLEWRRETAAKLAARYGTDQWSTPYPREILEERVAEGCTVMGAFEPGGPPVCTITITRDGDPALWSLEELAEPSWYLHKANVMVPGCGIGLDLFRWAIGRAYGVVGRLRIDVWSTNRRLQAWYVDHLGARHVRTVPGVVSGALFEIEPAPAAIGLAWRICDDQVTGWLRRPDLADCVVGDTHSGR